MLSSRRLTALPARDLKQDSDSKETTDFLITGDDPQLFLINGQENKVFAPGHYVLELDLTTDAPSSAEAELYLDIGDGFSPQLQITLRPDLKQANRFRCDFGVGAPIRCLRIDPPSGASRIRIRAVLRRQSQLWRAVRGATRLVAEKHRSPELIRLGLKRLDHILKAQGPRAAVAELRRILSRRVPSSHLLGIGPDKRSEWLDQQLSRSIRLPKPAVESSEAFKKAAIHAHLFYGELANELLDFLREPVKAGMHVHITVVSATVRDSLLAATSDWPVGRFEVHLVENQGRDLGPLFTTLKWLFEKYDYLCHIHSKVSPHTDFGDRWRLYLYDACIGSISTIQGILQTFQDQKDCGILYPDNFSEIRYSTYDEFNKSAVDRLLSLLDPAWQYQKIDFPAGSMCWLRTSIWRPYLDKLPPISAFEQESGQIDMTLAHVLERCLSLVPYLAGYDYRPYRHGGAQILEGGSGYSLHGWRRDTPLIALAPKRELLSVSKRFDAKSLDMHWVIPDFGKGAGGHQTIFRMMRHLEQRGHRHTIWLQNADRAIPAEKRLAEIREWYQPLKTTRLQHLPDEVAGISGDVVIATDCWTAYPVCAMGRFKERFYFIQDFEPDFHPKGEIYFTAENTYRFGFAALCAGPWLVKKAESYGMWARGWDLCNDHAVYRVDRHAARSPDQRFQIAFYARAWTPRRAVNLGLAALELLRRRGIDFDVHLFGQEAAPPDVFSFDYQNHGLLTPKELAALYNRCDVGLVFSATNYSLIPLEMMGCGLPVVEIDVPSTRAVFNEDIVAFAAPDPVSIADRLEELFRSQQHRSELAARGEIFAAGKHWSDSALAIEAAILERLTIQGFEPLDMQAALATPAIGTGARCATVMVPTLNAGPAFQSVLDRLDRQQTPWPYEVLIVDSGSEDGTLERATAFSKVRVHSIPKAEFQHGRTRNLAFSLSDSPFVAYLTQDATPADEHWLERLISGFDAGSRIAGVFGRHRAYPHHDPFVRRDLAAMFERFDRWPRVYDWATAFETGPAPGSLDWMLLVSFYSDNNSAMRRSVWEQIPYPDVPWGEDQIWAWEIIKAGFQKAYAPDATVFHSHPYEPGPTRKVAEEESRLFWHYFGHRFATTKNEAFTLMETTLAADRAFARAHGISEEQMQMRAKQVRDQTYGRNAHLFG